MPVVTLTVNHFLRMIPIVANALTDYSNGTMTGPLLRAYITQLQSELSQIETDELLKVTQSA